MISIDQLLESVDLDFEPRWVTKDTFGTIVLWKEKPTADKELGVWNCCTSATKMYSNLKIYEFDGKDWTECIYEVPRKTTGKIYKFDSSAIDTLYDNNPEKIKKFICGEIVCKLNEVIDAVNELKGAKNENS
jgi:hypothetical protein